MVQLPDDRPVTGRDEPLPALPPESSPDLAPPPAVSERRLGPPDESSAVSERPPGEPPAVSERPLDGPPARPERIKVPRTRTSAAWLGIWAGAAALILLIIFVAQNTATVEINFLWLSGHLSLAVAVLIAGVAGAIVALAIGAARIVQLRRLVRYGRARRSTPRS